MNKALLAIFLFFIFHSSHAELFVSLGVGQSDVEWFEEDLSRANAFEIKAAYHFSRHFSLEAAYNDLGRARSEAFDLARQGFSLGLGAYVPFAEHYKFFAKVAMIDYQTTLSADSAIFIDGVYSAGSSSPEIRYVDKIRSKDKDLLGSVGMFFLVNPRAGVYLQYTHYDFVQKTGAWIVGVSYSL